MPPSPAERAQIIAQIKASKQRLLDDLHADMDRVDDQLQALDEKVASGEDLTDDEVQLRQTLNDDMDTLSANEQRIVLWNLEELDNSAAIDSLKSEVDQANQELTAAKQRVENLTTTVNRIGAFLVGVTNVLTTLTGLLAALAPLVA